MGIFDFVKEAGERLFGGGDDKPARPERDLDTVLADKAKAETLSRLVRDLDLGIQDVRVKFRDGLATIEGRAANQAAREKAVLLVGNTQGVARVDDRMVVEAARAAARPDPEARMHTVVRGDTLSKIAKQHYGDAMKYRVIFEANQPMLKDPDRIYPGQVLRIPPLAED